MDLWSIRIIVEDKFSELFSEYFENFDGYLSSSLFQDKDLSVRYDISKSFNLTANKLGEFHLNRYWILEIMSVFINFTFELQYILPKFLGNLIIQIPYGIYKVNQKTFI